MKKTTIFSLEGSGTVRAGGRGDFILRWNLDRRVLVVLLTDAARDTPSLIFGYSYIWLGPLFVCPAEPSSCLAATTATHLSWNTRYMQTQKNIWSQNKILFLPQKQLKMGEK